MDDGQILIVGGSAAGASAAEAIAAAGGGRRVTLVSGEDRLPYKRTKLSKSFAAGFDRDAFALHDEGWYAERGVRLILGQRVRALGIGDGAALLEGGDRLPWSRVILATGAAPQRPDLPADVAELVYYAHGIDQVEALRARALRSDSALVVGMGPLGVEVTEQLARLGAHVTLVGASPTLLPGELTEAASGILAEVLQRHGVRLHFEETVAGLRRAARGLRARLASGSELPVGFVVYCIGLRPRTELAREAGLRVERGVLVDHALRTSHPDVFAAGDNAQHPDGRLTHLWRHALQQGQVAGRNALGGSERYSFLPFRLKSSIFGSYFFSVGRPRPERASGYEIVEHRQGERYLCGYYRGGALAGVVMCNDEPNQKLYTAAVIEGWDRARVASAFPGLG